MSNIPKLIKSHSFFNQNNNCNIFIYLFLYIIEYTIIIINSFITWNVSDYLNLVHLLTVITILYHIYNEIKREIIFINNIDYFYKHDKYKLVASYVILLSSYSFNISMSLLILNELNYNILYYCIIIIPSLFKSYRIITDKNYSASILFYRPIHYIRTTFIMNYNEKIEHFNNNTLYPKDIFV